jgi:hypothetical protein
MMLSNSAIGPLYWADIFGTAFSIETGFQPRTQVAASPGYEVGNQFYIDLFMNICKSGSKSMQSLYQDMMLWN